MEPGIELDIAVAKAVGLTVYDWVEAMELDLKDYSTVCVHGPYAGLQRYYLDRNTWLLKPWRPSSDIAIAMELFGRYDNWLLAKSRVLYTVNDILWTIYRDYLDLLDDIFLGRSPISAAHAIALAIIEYNRAQAAHIATQEH